MRRFKAAGDLDGDVEYVLERQRSGGDLVVEGFAVEVRHRDEGVPLDLVDFVDGADVGVVERGGGLGLAEEARLGFVV